VPKKCGERGFPKKSVFFPPKRGPGQKKGRKLFKTSKFPEFYPEYAFTPLTRVKWELEKKELEDLKNLFNRFPQIQALGPGKMLNPKYLHGWYSFSNRGKRC